jgi:hypothetical protein
VERLQICGGKKYLIADEILVSSLLMDLVAIRAALDACLNIGLKLCHQLVMERVVRSTSEPARSLYPDAYLVDAPGASAGAISTCHLAPTTATTYRTPHSWRFYFYALLSSTDMLSFLENLAPQRCCWGE